MKEQETLVSESCERMSQRLSKSRCGSQPFLHNFYFYSSTERVSATLFLGGTVERLQLVAPRRLQAPRVCLIGRCESCSFLSEDVEPDTPDGLFPLMWSQTSVWSHAFSHTGHLQD